MSAAQGRLGRWLLVAAGIAIIATVAAALWVMGSPGAQRLVRLDQRRVQDLQQVEQAIDLHFRRHDALPADLAALATQPGVRLAVADPVDGAAYGYEATGPRSYRLCARFDTDTAQAPDGARPWGGHDWSHGAGRHCFERRASDTESGRR